MSSLPLSPLHSRAWLWGPLLHLPFITLGRSYSAGFVISPYVTAETICGGPPPSIRYRLGGIFLAVEEADGVVG